jgi:ferredoxin-NADP reductase
VSAHAQAEWGRARVVEARPVARDVRRITLHRPGTRRAQPGEHLDLRLPLAGGADTRSYSIVESDDDGHLTLSVLKVPRSRGGSAFMHTVGEGQELWTSAPLQNFPLRPGAARYVLLAGGIGITALVETARVLRRLRADYTLVYVARDRERMAYLSRLHEEHGERLQVHIDAEGTPLDVDRLLGSLAARPDGGETEVYMCGPIRLMDALRRSWAAHGLPAHNLRYETFGNSGWFQAREFVASIPELGLETTVPAASTLLESLAQAGVDVMYDCRKGECGLCEMAVEEVDGRLDHRDVFLSDTQKATDRSMCVCVSRVVGHGDNHPGRLTLRLP